MACGEKGLFVRREGKLLWWWRKKKKKQQVEVEG